MDTMTCLRFSAFASLAIVAGCTSSTQRSDAASSTDAGVATDAFVIVDVGTIDDGGATDASSSTDAASSSDAAQSDAGGSLTTCGGFRGQMCAAGEYCQYTGPVTCGAADGTGVCRARPTSCAPDPDVVCGCDGTTYANACTAAMNGTDVGSSGSCGGATTFACGPSIACSADTQYCQITMGRGPTTYRCEVLTTCSAGARPSCATCSLAGMCQDVGPGEMTVTLLTP